MLPALPPRGPARGRADSGPGPGVLNPFPSGSSTTHAAPGAHGAGAQYMDGVQGCTSVAGGMEAGSGRTEYSPHVVTGIMVNQGFTAGVVQWQGWGFPISHCCQGSCRPAPRARRASCTACRKSPARPPDGLGAGRQCVCRLLSDGVRTVAGRGTQSLMTATQTALKWIRTTSWLENGLPRLAMPSQVVTHSS